MENKIIMAGFGGQGVLSIGKFLAYAGMEENLEVTWMPSYGPEMRGGTANCSVVMSDRPVGSPVISYRRLSHRHEQALCGEVYRHGQKGRRGAGQQLSYRGQNRAHGR